MCDLFKVIVSPWRGQYWFLKKVPLYRAWNAQCVMWSQFRKNGLSLPSLTHSFVCSSYCALSVELDARNTPVSSTGLILRRNLIIVRGWCWHEGNDGRLGNREAKEARGLLFQGEQMGIATEQRCNNISKAQQWKSLSRVWLFATPWTIQSMEFSRPEYWSG